MLSEDDKKTISAANKKPISGGYPAYDLRKKITIKFKKMTKKELVNLYKDLANYVMDQKEFIEKFGTKDEELANRVAEDFTNGKYTKLKSIEEFISNI